MAHFIGGHLDVPRAVLCVCGWGGRFTTLRAANDAAAAHIADGCEGCDHVTRIESDLEVR